VWWDKSRRRTIIYYGDSMEMTGTLSDMITMTSGEYLLSLVISGLAGVFTLAIQIYFTDRR